MSGNQKIQCERRGADGSPRIFMIWNPMPEGMVFVNTIVGFKIQLDGKMYGRLSGKSEEITLELLQIL